MFKKIKEGGSSTKTKKSLNVWMFIVYPAIAVFTVISFLFVFFTVLPLINEIGVLAFGANEATLITYGILPFICIDMCIVKGYFIVLKRIIKGIIKFFNEREEQNQ